MPGVGDALLQNQLHELLGGRAHILESLPERNDSEAHTLKVLHHLHSTPTVERDLTDIEPFPETLDELLNVPVMDNVSFRGLQVSLACPHIVIAPFSVPLPCRLRSNTSGGAAGPTFEARRSTCPGPHVAVRSPVPYGPRNCRTAGPRWLSA